MCQVTYPGQQCGCCGVGPELALGSLDQRTDGQSVELWTRRHTSRGLCRQSQSPGLRGETRVRTPRWGEGSLRWATGDPGGGLSRQGGCFP